MPTDDELREKFQGLLRLQTEAGTTISRHFEKILRLMQRGEDVGALQESMTAIREQYERWMAKAGEIDVALKGGLREELQRLLDQGATLAETVIDDLRRFEQRLDQVLRGN